MLAERERRLELLLERVDAQPLEPPRLAVEPRQVSEPLQRGAPAQRQRRRDRRRGRARIALAKRCASLPQQLLELQRVHARLGQRVSVGRPDDRLVAEGGAQTCHMMLYSVPRGRRQVLSPQRADQLVDRHDPPLPKGEQRQQGIALAASHGHRASARRNLERAEDPDLERIDHAEDSSASLTRSTGLWEASDDAPATSRPARRSPCG